jgi:hypothetical protein
VTHRHIWLKQLKPRTIQQRLSTEITLLQKTNYQQRSRVEIPLLSQVLSIPWSIGLPSWIALLFVSLPSFVMFVVVYSQPFLRVRYLLLSLDCDIWFLWSIRPSKSPRCSSWHMVSSTLELSCSVLYGTEISVAQIVCCDSDSKAWELLLSLIVQYLSTYMPDTFIWHICVLLLDNLFCCSII